MTHKKLINPTVSLYPASFPKTNMFSREWSVEQLVRKYYFIYKNCNIIGGPFDVYLSLDQGWVTLSADPRHLGALRRTVSLVSEGGGGGMKEWMKRICPSFTRSRITLVESAHLFHGSICFQLFFLFKNKTKIKTYLRARVLGVLGALRSLRILRILVTLTLRIHFPEQFNQGL